MSTFRIHHVFALALVSALASGALVTGCGGPSIQALCERACACDDCSAKDLDECTTELEEEQKTSAAVGCADVFDGLLDCYDQYLACDGDDAEAKQCEAQAHLVEKCVDKGSVATQSTDCDDAADHLVECKSAVQGEIGGQCIGSAQCSAKCILASSCETIDEAFGSDPPPENDLLQCIDDCAG